MTRLISPTTKLRETENNYAFHIVWLGLRDVVPRDLGDLANCSTACYSFDACKKYIETVQNPNRILLVLMGFYEYLSYFNNFPQIQSIFIVKKDYQHLKITKQIYPKLVSIFLDEDLLIQRLRQVKADRTDASEKIFYIQEKSEGQTLMRVALSKLFIWNRLMNSYLINTASDVDMMQLKQNMIERCRLEYKDDKNHVQVFKDIDEFDKTCTVDNAVQWYTKDKFVFRLVNKAFRKQNIDVIWKFQYFIKLLHRQLYKLSIEQQGENLVTLYRGQVLGSNQIKDLQRHVGHLVSTITFLSTTRTENVARVFSSRDNNGVLFQINVASRGNPDLYPFADISRLHAMGQDEDEVLFFPGAVFRVDSVKQEADSTWLIKLTLINERLEIEDQIKTIFEKTFLIQPKYVRLLDETDDYRLFNRYHEYFTNNKFLPDDIKKLVTYINPNRLMHNAGDSNKTIDYYEELLANENFIDLPKYTVLLILIGINYLRLSQYDYAVDCFTDALDEIDNGNQLAGEVYKYIGDVWRKINDLETALLWYKKAEQNLLKSDPKRKSIGPIYQKISEIYFEQNNYKRGGFYKVQADEVIKYRTETKSTLIDEETLVKYRQLNVEFDWKMIKDADLARKDGMDLIRCGYLDQGLKRLLDAEELFKKHLPIYDLMDYQLAKLYEHTIATYLFRNDYFNALRMWKKAIDIRLSFNDYE